MPQFSELFHQSSKELTKGRPFISSDPTQWPEEWKTIYHKAYPRFPVVSLPKGEINETFSDVFKKRASSRHFSKEYIAQNTLGSLLHNSLGYVSCSHEEEWRRSYPSPGARYSIEAYLICPFGAEGVWPGVYHYNVQKHGLVTLSAKEDDARLDELVTYEWAKTAPILLVLTGVFWRMQNKYGERGYRYVLLEAGHISQNVHLISTALGLSCCGLAGTNDEKIEQRLGIDGISESILLSIAVGI